MIDDAVMPLVNFEVAERRARYSKILLAIKALVLSIQIREENNHD